MLRYTFKENRSILDKLLNRLSRFFFIAPQNDVLFYLSFLFNLFKELDVRSLDGEKR